MPFIYSLCSSSKGNCTYLGTQTDGILIDAGIGVRNFAAQMSLIDVDPSAVRGIFITHEHSDHIKGLCKLQARLKVPVYASEGTCRAIREKGAVENPACLHVISQNYNPNIWIEGMEISSFSTSHDAAQSQCYTIAFPEGQPAAVCTDLGLVTPEVHDALLGNDIVMLESNYEKNLLQIGVYPPFLKRRISGKRGHLSNEDCAEEILRLYQSGIKKFILGHLSEENNYPELAFTNVVAELDKIGAALKQDYDLWVAPKANRGEIVML